MSLKLSDYIIGRIADKVAEELYKKNKGKGTGAEALTKFKKIYNNVVIRNLNKEMSIKSGEKDKYNKDGLKKTYTASSRKTLKEEVIKEYDSYKKRVNAKEKKPKKEKKVKITSEQKEKISSTLALYLEDVNESSGVELLDAGAIYANFSEDLEERLKDELDNIGKGNISKKDKESIESKTFSKLKKNVKADKKKAKKEQSKVGKLPADFKKFLEKALKENFKEEADFVDLINTKSFYTGLKKIKSRAKAVVELKKFVEENTTKVKTGDGIFYEIFSTSEIFDRVNKLLGTGNTAKKAIEKFKNDGTIEVLTDNRDFTPENFEDRSKVFKDYMKGQNKTFEDKGDKQQFKKIEGKIINFELQDDQIGENSFDVYYDNNGRVGRERIRLKTIKKIKKPEPEVKLTNKTFIKKAVKDLTKELSFKFDTEIEDRRRDYNEYEEWYKTVGKFDLEDFITTEYVLGEQAKQFRKMTGGGFRYSKKGEEFRDIVEPKVKKAFLKMYKANAKRVDKIKKQEAKTKLDEAFKNLETKLKKTKVKKEKKGRKPKTPVELDDPKIAEDDIDRNKKLSYIQFLKKYQLSMFMEEDWWPENPSENMGKVMRLSRMRLITYMFNFIPNDKLPTISYFIKYPKPSNMPRMIERKTGLAPLTDDELLMLSNHNDKSDIYMGLDPIGIYTGKESIKLLDHQKKFLEGFLLGNLRSAVLFHGVGTGKTFSAVGTAKTYLQIYPKNKVIVCTPPAVLFNFVDSMVFYGMNPQDPRFEYYSYTKFANNQIDTRNCMVIIDEAHNLRTEIQGVFELDSYDDKEKVAGVSKGKRPAKTIIKTEKAHKIILLTATPLVNIPYDLENLMAIGDGRPPINQSEYGKMVSNREMRTDYFRFRISKYMRQFSKGDYPDMRERYVALPQGSAKNNQALIAIVKKGFNEVYSASRQAGLEKTKDKFDYVLDTIKKEPTKKFVVYSTFLQSGVDVLSTELQEAGFSHAIISGKVNTLGKATAIDGFNGFDDPDHLGEKYQVLIITKAGAEGVDLKRTRGIFVMDGVWNEALYEQIVARAVRYKSHATLPEKDQYVDVYKLFVCFDNEVPLINDLNKGKKFNYERLLQKIKEQKELLKKLDKAKKEGIQNVGEVKRETAQQVLVASQNPNFDEAKFNQLKKGSTERKKYIEDNLKFGKDKARYELGSIIGSKSDELPSTDWFMFILQKVKLNKINQLYEELSKIPSVEKSVSDIPEAKKVFDKINKILSKGKPSTTKTEKVVEILQNSIGKRESRAVEDIKKNLNKTGSQIDDIILKSQELKMLRANKARARVNQEFFTPSAICKDLIKFSGFDKLDKFTVGHILEPSAGWGNIVKELLNVMEKKKYNMRIDCVEYNESNREELEKIADVVPSVVSVMAENNFLNFITSTRYEYVFMNPPFHLQKKLVKELKEDAFDYHFVMRAYSLLALGGVLIAIIGRNYEKSSLAKKFFKKVGAELKNKNGVKWTGPEVKKGGEVQSLNITYVYIKRQQVNSKEEDEILQITGSLYKT